MVPMTCKRRGLNPLNWITLSNNYYFEWCIKLLTSWTRSSLRSFSLIPYGHCRIPISNSSSMGCCWAHALFFCSSVFLTITQSTAVDTFNSSQPIADGDTIVSAGDTFVLGFFSPRNSSTNRYLGIWYRNIPGQAVVWVANRDNPINGSTGLLTVNSQGNLALVYNLNNGGSSIWSSNSSRPARNPVAQLLDSGNLVVREAGDDDNFLWQSFDYPCDTLLPGMKLGLDRRTGFDRYLTSSKAADDPSSGGFTYRIDPRGYPEIIQREGSTERYRTGPWNGLRFSGTPYLRPNPIYMFQFVVSDQEIYYSYLLDNTSTVSRLVLNQNGVIQRLTWSGDTQGWVVYVTAQMDFCDRYALCGAYGRCNIRSSPVCNCLRGFEPKVPNEWELVNWSNGCVRQTALNCSGDGFVKYSGVKLPETRRSWFNVSMSLEECRGNCLRSCNCTAYANIDIRNGGSGCLLWFSELIDIRELEDSGQDIYIRMAASEIVTVSSGGSKRKTRLWIIAVCLLAAGIGVLGLFLILRFRRKRLKRQASIVTTQARDLTVDVSREHDLELPLFDFSTIATATDLFSESRKLGEGGFGPVYKGVFKDGQEMAVKRLSKDSTQGLDEFKNEVKTIAKLQHRNLVKLLGCCIEKEEKVLIYEYMPNKGLDAFIFDQKQRKLLDWPMRFQIINGIARGLLYLHQDSRLRIIHRDLKASNVLLDYNMNPKISDFGMARIFGGNQTQGNTRRVVGTYGYMSPEYAIDGQFSIKSDVFSYGVLVLEIICGKRNRGFYHEDHNHNLLGHAWRLYKEGKPEEVMDETVKDSSWVLSEVVRCIHVALLCVQQGPEDRPNMSNVVLMLSSDILLPEPTEPGFFTERKVFEQESSTNEITITLLTAR
ncbi:unnamed protein product [Linum tenue]|uniref:Receptor-like serine/threonine-protein kinase n=1 Tax=Linum tenue TaxID=586396 RepID=A0AAV0M036_9ROSI|nr:unnamed protein product [Linum tenue]